MKQNLLIKQKQTLQLSPQMYQSIKILQMNNIELKGWLEKEAQENPVLEVYTGQDEYPESDNKELEIDLNQQDGNALIEYFVDQKNVANNRNVVQKEREIEPVCEDLNKICLSESLLLNFKIIAEDDLELKIGEYLIGNIDCNGYLTISCREAARDLNVTEKKVRLVLAMIQNCSIPGMAARDLKECLLLQLKYLKLPEKKYLKNIILFHLDKLSKKDFKGISKDLHIPYQEIQHLLDIIKKYFNPKPGRAFVQDREIGFLVPDIIVKKINDQYEILENYSLFPKIKTNLLYEKMLADYKLLEKIKNQDPISQKKWLEVKTTLRYLNKKIDSAQWILKCLEQRRNTIINITRFIIEYQQDFIEKGVAYLKPLSLENVADSLNLNKSTISRAIKSKRIQLPRGMYNFKYFFSTGLQQDNKEVISVEKIKNLIRNYLEKEDSCKPLSDQKIVELLKEKEEIRIARRTVAKYRIIMNIPSANLRKIY